MINFNKELMKMDSSLLITEEENYCDYKSKFSIKTSGFSDVILQQRAAIRIIMYFQRWRRKRLLNSISLQIKKEAIEEPIFNKKIEDKKFELETKCLQKYEKVSKSINQPYSLELVELFDLQSILFEYKNHYSFLKTKRILVFIWRIINLLSFKINSSVLFANFIFLIVLIDSALLIFNVEALKLKIFFSSIYMIQIICKLNAYGLQMNKNTYLSNKWNILDCIFVFSIFIVRCGNLTQTKSLFFVHNCIILRLIQISSFKIVLEKLFFSLQLLFETISIISVFVISLAILSTRLFDGLLLNRCMEIKTGQINDSELCGVYNCPIDYICISGFSNPDKGMTHFDEIGTSILLIIRIITLDSWYDLLVMLNKGANNLSFIFFIPVIIFGNFCLFNLMLAVLKVGYSQCDLTIVNEIKQYLDQYKEKCYDLRILKEKGYYKKDKTNGIRHVGAKVNHILRINTRSKLIIENDKKKSSFFKILKEQSNNFSISKHLKNIINIVQKKNHIDLDELSSLGQKKIQIRVKKNQIYEFTSLNEVVLNKQEKDIRNLIYCQKKQLFPLKLPFNYTADFLVEEKKRIIRKLTTRKKILSSNNNHSKQKKHVREIFKLALHKRDIKKKFSLRDNSPVLSPRVSHNKKSSFKKKRIVKQFKKKRLGEMDSNSVFLTEEDQHTIKAKNTETLMSFDTLKFLINEKIKREKINEDLIEIQYYEINKNDMKRGIIERDNWSGYDVLIIPKYKEKSIKRLLIALNTFEIAIWTKGLSFIAFIMKNVSKTILKKGSFKSLLISIEILNTLSLSFEGIISDSTNFRMNIIIRSFFFFEMCLKMCSIGIQKYMKDGFNIIDMLSVFYSMMEILSENNELIKGSIYSKYQRFFRFLLVLRIIKLCQKLEYMNYIIKVVKSATSSLLTIFFLFCLILTFYSLVYSYLSIELSLKLESQLFSEYFASVFIITTLDNWYSLLLLTTNDTDRALFAGFIISIILIGNFIFLNLFLTILLDAFVKDSIIINRAILDEESRKENLARFLELSADSFEERRNAMDKNTDLSNLITSNNDLNQNSQSFKRKKIRRVSTFIENLSLNKSFFIFDETDWIRLTCTRVSETNFFKKLVYFCLILNIIILAIESFDNFKYNRTTSIQIFNLIFTICLKLFFISELILKSISKGFILGKSAYIKSFSNVINLISLLGFVYFLLSSNKNSILPKSAICLDLLIPFRLLEHNKSLKDIFLALIKSLDEIFNVIVALLIVWFIFAIWGVILFRDRFGYCKFPENYYIGIEKCSKSDWIINNFNFDNVYSAFLVLLDVSTFDNWSYILTIAANSNLPENGPVPLNNKYSAYIYFGLFIFIGIWLFLNLLLGVFFSNFASAEREKKNEFLSEKNAKWIDIQNKILKELPLSYTLPKSGARYYLMMFFRSKIYKKLIMTILFVNLIVLSLYKYNMNDHLILALYIIERILITIYGIEFSLKLLALGVSALIYHRSLNIEFIVFFTYFISLFFESVLTSNNTLFRLFNCLKICSLIRLTIRIKRVKNLWRAFESSLPLVLNLLSLIMLVFFVYSCIGNLLFDKGEINKEYGFMNVFSGFLILFRCLTCDGWGDIMFSYIKHYNEFVVYLFFISFMIISFFFLFNVFIMVLLKEFEEFYMNPMNPLQFYEKIVRKFKVAWSFYSKTIKNKKNIKINKLIDFLRFLGPPLGVKKNDIFIIVAKKIMNFNLKNNNDGFIYFNELLHATLKLYYTENGMFDDLNSAALKTLEKAEKMFFTKLKRKKIEEAKNPILFLKSSLMKTFKKKKKKIKKKSTFLNNNRLVINPVYDYLINLMAFKSWKKFLQKNL